MSNDIQVQFADFWSEWPNKVSKAPAQEAWRSLSDGERAEATKNAARWYQRWRRECPRATKIGASRYLSERRWQDHEGDTAPKPADKLAFYAAWVNSDKHLPANTISQAMLTEMIRAELVTPERARERGLAA